MGEEKKATDAAVANEYEENFKHSIPGLIEFVRQDFEKRDVQKRAARHSLKESSEVNACEFANMCKRIYLKHTVGDVSRKTLFEVGESDAEEHAHWRRGREHEERGE
jgi:hypothetical protein